MPLDWLEEQLEANKNPEAVLDIPKGGEFVRGLAGTWDQYMAYKLYTDGSIDLKEHEIEYDLRVPTRSGGSFWYWKQVAGREKSAMEAAKLIEWKSPNRCWRWQIPTASIVGWSGEKSPEEVFGTDLIGYDIEVASLGYSKRTEFHLLFLPSLVQAFAVKGELMDQVFNYSNLVSDYAEVTGGYLDRIVGPMAEKERSWRMGQLWQAREAIWLALGEENPEMYTWNVASDTDTVSKKLGSILRIMTTPNMQFHARLDRVAAQRDKTEKEKGGDNNPFPMVVFCDVWRNREEMIAEIGTSGEDAEFPPVPEQWASMAPKAFLEWVNEFISTELGDGPVPVLLKKLKKIDDIEETLALTAEELVPWIELAKK